MEEEAYAPETIFQLEPYGTELISGEKLNLTDNTSPLRPALLPELRLTLFLNAEELSLLERSTEEPTSPSERTIATTGPTLLLPMLLTSRKPSSSLLLKERQTLTTLSPEGLDALGTSFLSVQAADSSTSTCGTEMITQEDNSGRLRSPVRATPLLLVEEQDATELCFLQEPPGGDLISGRRTTDLADRYGSSLRALLTSPSLWTTLRSSGGESQCTTPGTGDPPGNSPRGTGSLTKAPTGDSGGETTDS